MRIVPITELSGKTIEAQQLRVRRRLNELMVKSGRAETEQQVDLQDADFNNPHLTLDFQDYNRLEPGVIQFRLPGNGFGAVTYVGLRNPVQALPGSRPPNFPEVLMLKTGTGGHGLKAALGLQPLWTPTLTEEVAEAEQKRVLVYPCKGFLADPVLYGPSELAYFRFYNVNMAPADFSALVIGGMLALPSFPINYSA